MSNGPITTRFEERANKLLARLGTDDDVKAFLPHLTRALIDTVSELEATAHTAPTEEPIRKAVEPPNGPQEAPANDTDATYIDPQRLPMAWLLGTDFTQDELHTIASVLQTRAGEPFSLKVIIYPKTLEVFVRNPTTRVHTFLGAVDRTLEPLYSTYTENGPITTTARITYVPEQDFWGVQIGRDS